MNQKHQYQLQLKVDNAQELLNSVLLWKYSNQKEHKIIKSTHLQDDIAQFQFEARESSPIEYWYQNSQNIQETVRRKLSKQKNIVDKFDCINLIVSCSTQKENVILYYECGSKQKIINFNQQQLIHLDFKCQKINFMLENQDSDYQIRETKFHINLNYSILNSQYLLEISEYDLEQLNYNYQSFKSKNGQFEFQNLIQNRHKLEDVLFFKYSQFQQDCIQRDDLCQTFFNVTQNLETILKPMKTHKDTFTQINNFFQEKQLTETFNSLSEIKISQTQYQERQQPIFQRCNSQRCYTQNEEAKQNKMRQQKNIIKVDQLMQECQIKQKQEQLDILVDNQSQILQANIVQNNQSQFNQNQEIDELRNKIQKFKNDYQKTIDELNIVIYQLKIQNKKLKEQNEEMQIKLQRFNNYRQRRYKNPARNKNSINHNFQLNPIIEAAKLDINQNLEQCQVFIQSIDTMTESQMMAKSQQQFQLQSQRLKTQYKKES